MFTRTRFQFGAPLLLAGLLAFSGCKGESGGPAASSNEFLVGHYGSMSGGQATFGQSTDNGIKLAIEEINAKGGVAGKTVKLITYDDKGDAKEAGAAVTRLITRDKVQAVLGEVASSLSLAGAPVCQENGIPMISPSSTNERVTKVGDMIFRVCFIDPFQGSVCAKFAYENDKVKARKVAILYDQASAYSTGLANEFERAFKKMGGAVVAREAYNEGDPDFNAQLTAIRSAAPDAIFVPGYYTDVGNIARQARGLSIQVPLIGGDGWDSAELAKIGGEAINGCFYANHYSPEDPSPRVREFIEKYQKAYGSIPDGLAALGYDAARILADAASRAKSLSGEDLAAALAETKNFEGVTGTISLDKDRNAVKSAVILEMVDGKAKFVTTVSPE